MGIVVRGGLVDFPVDPRKILGSFSGLALTISGGYFGRLTKWSCYLRRSAFVAIHHRGSGADLDFFSSSFYEITLVRAAGT
jgi:hypothetical protein